MATSVTLEADGKGEIISGFLSHACSQLPHSQVMSLRLSPTVYTGESSYPLKVLPILQAASFNLSIVMSRVAENILWIALGSSTVKCSDPKSSRSTLYSANLA